MTLNRNNQIGRSAYKLLGVTIFCELNLLHLDTPHGAADINDEYDVLGKWREVGRSEELDKVAVRHLEDKSRYCSSC